MPGGTCPGRSTRGRSVSLACQPVRLAFSSIFYRRPGTQVTMTFQHTETVPLPLALHLATYTVIGLFCAFAGGLNLIDPTKIFPNAIIFLGLAGFSWGYVFGILMARKEVLGLGLVTSVGYIVAGIWQLGPHWALGALLLAIGVYGLAALALYRRQILEA